MKEQDLPTVEECQAFLAAINKGRAVYGLKPTKIDYEACDPGNPEACLSATTLAVPAGGKTGALFFEGVSQRDELARALGTRVFPMGVRIPEVVLRITEPYDSLAEMYEYDPEFKALNEALHARLVEAGVAV